MAELFKGLIGNEVTFAPEGDPIIDWTTLFFKKKSQATSINVKKFRTVVGGILCSASKTKMPQSESSSHCMPLNVDAEAEQESFVYGRLYGCRHAIVRTSHLLIILLVSDSCSGK